MHPKSFVSNFWGAVQLVTVVLGVVFHVDSC